MILRGSIVPEKLKLDLSLVLPDAPDERDAWQSLRSRRFDIDSLMIVAAAGAAALGAWVEGALLLFLFSLGHALEHLAMDRARKAIEALAPGRSDQDRELWRNAWAIGFRCLKRGGEQ